MLTFGTSPVPTCSIRVTISTEGNARVWTWVLLKVCQNLAKQLTDTYRTISTTSAPCKDRAVQLESIEFLRRKIIVQNSKDYIVSHGKAEVNCKHLFLDTNFRDSNSNPLFTTNSILFLLRYTNLAQEPHSTGRIFPIPDSCNSQDHAKYAF